jgi:histidinol dehydrogenase
VSGNLLQVIDLRPGGVPLESRRPEPDPEVEAAVRAIIRRVRDGKDVVLLELTRQFDGADLSGAGLAATDEELRRAAAETDPELRAAIDSMIERLGDLHARQLPTEWRAERDGLVYGEIVRPISRAGCYVPGGRAAYPSTAVMTVVPAVVAGVEEVVLCTPPRPDGSLPAAVLYAAAEAGAGRVIKVGGAQAVAALAYGTETVPRVDKIVGPGNVYVTEAKRQLTGIVGIDGLAGPSELVIVADGSADPELVAADLVAQAEHDPLASTTLVTTDPDFPERVRTALEREARTAARAEIVGEALGHTQALLVRDPAAAADAVDALAPEHLQVLLQEPEGFLPLVRNAGAVFVGPWSAVPFGDYGAGSNHVLPTMGTARFASGLRASDFVTVSPVIELSARAAGRLAPEVATVARSEGLDAHARAAELRAERATAERPVP